MRKLWAVMRHEAYNPGSTIILCLCQTQDMAEQIMHHLFYYSPSYVLGNGAPINHLDTLWVEPIFSLD